MIDDDEIDERLVNSGVIDNIESNDISLRPRRISEFIGQPQVQKNLLTFITAAESRKEAMDHVLLFGPPGLGKTTLAQIISIELGVGLRATSGPIISKAGDLAALLMIGPEVALKPTPSSIEIICASVVLPSPGGPNKST